MAFQSIQLFLKLKNVVGHWELTICDGETVGWSTGPTSWWSHSPLGCE